ncbi:MAG TPA: LysR family transcriptional regulator [Hyphomicrobiaceae bacterium]
MPQRFGMNASRRMDSRQLRYFDAVARERSFHKAAERLRISQPALSRHIQRLEEEFGTPLLVRHTRGIDLTSEGEILLRHATSILRQFEAARDDVLAHAVEPTGTVSIGAPPTISAILFGDLTGDVARKAPNVSLTLCEGITHYLTDWLETGQLDVAVVGNPPPLHSIATEHLLDEEVYLVGCRSTAFPKENLLPEALVDLPLILATRMETIGSWLEERLGAVGERLNVRYRVESPAIALDLVRRSLGLAVLPRSAIWQKLNDGQIHTALIRQVTLSRYIALPQDRPRTKAMEIVLGSIRERLAHFDGLGAFRSI